MGGNSGLSGGSGRSPKGQHHRVVGSKFAAAPLAGRSSWQEPHCASSSLYLFAKHT